jgi:hypothetical protein
VRRVIIAGGVVGVIVVSAVFAVDHLGGTKGATATSPAGVSALFNRYLERQHPDRGKVEAGTTCVPNPHRSFRGHQIYGCMASQREGFGAAFYAECVVSTSTGLITSDDHHELRCDYSSPRGKHR